MTITLLESHPNAYSSVVRKAIIHTPPAIVAVSLTTFAASSLFWGDSPLPIGLIIFGLFAFSFSLQSIAALRDLRSSPITTQGEVRRSWRRSRFLFIGRIHYLQVERRVFEIGAVAHLELQPGDTVEILHWPHTNTIVTLNLHRSSGEQSTGQSVPWS